MLCYPQRKLLHTRLKALQGNETLGKHVHHTRNGKTVLFGVIHVKFSILLQHLLGSQPMSQDRGGMRAGHLLH